MGNSFMNPALRTSASMVARDINAPQYAARGQGIASQKYLDIAQKLLSIKPKKTQRGAAYPPTKAL
jgi:hypothetical protein